MQRLESVRGRPVFSADIQSHLLERVTAAEGLEKYLGTKYPGTKRFGLEGGESLIPMLDELIQRSGSYGTKEVVIGMAHRGRLNVLVNTFGKNPRDLFDEFEGKKKVELGSGDVKYHQGFSSNVMTAGGEVHLAMAFNPSHPRSCLRWSKGRCVRVRIVATIRTATRFCRFPSTATRPLPARAWSWKPSRCRRLAASRRAARSISSSTTVGFTISNPLDSRSTEYATDVAKMIQAPILHVNGDDPEAVMFVTQLAIDYRMQFKRDIVIDTVCYRRRGHNEADEPSGTQPLMYQQITKQRTTRELYAEHLIKTGVLDDARVQAKVDDYRSALDNGLHVVKSLVKEPNKELFVDWRPYLGHAWTARHDTSFDLKTLQELSAKLMELPEGFVVQRQVQKIYEDRQKMQAGGLPINWGYAETMAYATLAFEGHPIRMTGQDIGRGTFSHRHAVLHNQKDAGTYIPLQNLYSVSHVSTCTTRSFRRRLYWHSNTAIRPPSLMRWLSGKPSSATSPTVPRWLSTSSSPAASTSGAVCAV